MKKTDFKSLIIGFLLATCMFLFMGSSYLQQKYGDVLKVEVVNSSFPKSLDVNIKDFPSYDKLKVDVVDMP
tara:strand:- start:836 stop:1048 length:213 start_codon:yes stop_codon:yes gene_type:complete